MPATDVHLVSSVRRTGQEHRAVHEFVDAPGKKDERHDIKKIYEFGEMFRKSHGDEAVQEYIRHIHDDLRGKFGHLIEDLEKSVKGIASSPSAAGDGGELSRKLLTLVRETDEEIHRILAYFGVAVAEPHDPIADADVALLRRAGVSPDDVEHSVRVARKALDVARRTGAAVDLEFVGRAALFHDLGKAQTHAIEHGRLGAEAGRKLGLPENVTAVMEKHIRGGLTPAEARELGLPEKDYTLHTLEERIIIYSDRLVDIITDGVVRTEPEAEERFEEILATNVRYGKNQTTLARYLGYHREIQGLVRKGESQ
jgi:uncharacterized protein